MKNIFKNKRITGGLLAVAVVLMVFSGVQTSRAALEYIATNSYNAQMEMSNIGVTLNENGVAVAVGAGETGATAVGELMSGITDPVNIGVKYDERLDVVNSGTIDEYVRVIITKSWVDENGEKDTTLTPDLIHLSIGDGWAMDESASTDERVVLYYQNVLAAGAATPAICDSVWIDESLSTAVVQDPDGSYRFEYEGMTFNISVEVNGVQTHNISDAAKSAWGVDASKLGA